MFSPHPIDQQVSPGYNSFLTGTQSYDSKVTPIGAVQVEENTGSSFDLCIQNNIHSVPLTSQALTLLEINIGRDDSPYCSDSWAIRENISQ